MVADHCYFREYSEEDVPYTLSIAIIYYLARHLKEAYDLADQICDDNGESRLLTWDDCWEIIGKMTPDDAFCAGLLSDAMAKGGYHTFDGKCFRRIPDPWAYMKDIFTFAANDIANGRYEISDGLRKVIDAAERGDFKNCNARPKAGSGKRPAPRSSKNTRSKAGAKAPAKKTTNRAPARRH